MPKLLFARRERTIEKVCDGFTPTAEETRFIRKQWDVVLYKDLACSEVYARYPYYLKAKRPRRRQDHVILNYARHELCWLPDATEPAQQEVGSDA